MSSITIMTAQGRAQLAAAVANAQSFPTAKIVVGDGNGATYVPNEAQVALVHEVWRGNATVARTDDRVIFQAVIPAEVGGFTVREVGVFIGEAGNAQLFIISQHPVTQKIAAPANGSGPLPITIAFSASAAEQAVLPIGSSDNATLQLSRAPHITVDGLVTEPPAEPADGSLYAIATGAAGLFVGKGGWLVERVAGAWIYKQPPDKSVIRLMTNGAWYQRNGADWVALTFEDTSILWAQIQDPPVEFPPSVHNHDERYFTELETAALLAGKSDNGHLHDDRYFTEGESDGRFVQKAGDTLSGMLYLNNGVGLAFKNGSGDYVFGAAGGIINGSADGALYIQNFQNSTRITRAGGVTTAEFKQDGSVAFSGDVAAGTVSAGTVASTTLTATTVAGVGAVNINAAGIGAVWSLLMGGGYQLEILRQGVGKALSIGNYGELGFGPAADYGVPGKIAASNGAGLAASWKTLADLGMLTQVIASVDVRGGVVAAVGCSCVSDGVGAYGATAASALEQETTYLVTLGSAAAALIGNASQYLVLGYVRQAIGPNTYIYGPNGESTGQPYPTMMPAAVADNLIVKNAGSFRIASAGHLSLQIYKVS